MWCFFIAGRHKGKQNKKNNEEYGKVGVKVKNKRIDKQMFFNKKGKKENLFFGLIV